MSIAASCKYVLLINRIRVIIASPENYYLKNCSQTCSKHRNLQMFRLETQIITVTNSKNMCKCVTLCNNLNKRERAVFSASPSLLSSITV
jgi:hypothetical protein